MTGHPDHCTCPYTCPSCTAAFPVPSLCHQHRVTVHGVACGADGSDHDEREHG